MYNFEIKKIHEFGFLSFIHIFEQSFVLYLEFFIYIFEQSFVH